MFSHSSQELRGCCILYRLLICKYDQYNCYTPGLRSLLTPGRGAVHWGQAGRKQWHLKEVEHLCSSKSCHREPGCLYGPESPDAQPLVAGDTLKTIYSQATVLLYRLTEWNYTLLTLIEGTASKLSLKSVSNSSAKSSSKSATWEREPKYQPIIFKSLLEEVVS